MLQFINRETYLPEPILRIGTNGKASVLIRGFRDEKDQIVQIVRGPGKAVKAGTAYAPLAHYSFTGLTEQSVIQAFASGVASSAELPVTYASRITSYREIAARLGARRIAIDLDKHIDEVIHLSDVIGEGIYFRPRDARAFQDAIVKSGEFHHDRRDNFWGRRAASATKGEGYRELNSPSLHVAIRDDICSVHIDSYAFMLHGEDGMGVIGADVIQHIPDELFFRQPLNWLQRKNYTFTAALLERLHPVLPNSKNGYRGAAGLAMHLGAGPNSDLKTGVPRLTLEATYRPFGDDDKLRFTGSLRLLHGGDAERQPSWTLTLNASRSCSGISCSEHQDTVGLMFNVDLDAKTKPRRSRRP